MTVRRMDGFPRMHGGINGFPRIDEWMDSRMVGID